MKIVWIEGPPEELKAGMLVMVEGKLLVVGHVNDQGGVCDDCVGVHVHQVTHYSLSLIDELGVA